jgi:hypothetical protein
MVTWPGPHRDQTVAEHRQPDAGRAHIRQLGLDVEDRRPVGRREMMCMAGGARRADRHAGVSSVVVVAAAIVAAGRLLVVSKKAAAIRPGPA